MRFISTFALLAALAPAVLAQDSGRFDVAVTIDDLPAHGDLPPGLSRLGIVQDHLKILKAHRVPEAYGFVNASRLEGLADGPAALDAWRAAGYPLGNHGYAHMNLGRAESFAAWRQDVIQGEPAVSSRMQGADWHYFRVPNLALGRYRNEALALLSTPFFRNSPSSPEYLPNGTAALRRPLGLC